MTDQTPEPIPNENKFELTLTATGVVGQGTAPDEGETP